jgi:glycosyltransferase involved in cell wall biosynthesis
MKIAFITLGFSPYRASGLDLSGERLVLEMIRLGNEVSVIAGRQGNTKEVINHPSLNIIRIPLDNSDWIGFGYKAAKKLINLDSHDIVHFWDIHFGWAYRNRFIGSLQHSFQQRINSLGSLSMGSGRNWIIKFPYYTLAKYFLEIPSINRANGLLAGSLTSKDGFIKDYRIPPEKIKIARHGVDTNFFEPKVDVQSRREKLGIKPHEPVILFVGFITPRKGLEYLAHALPSIQPRPKLLIIGRWRSMSYRNKIMELLQPFKEQVIELGFVDDEEMPYFFSMSDVYVSSSLLEGFGLPIPEALACGTPVVAADSGSVAEVMGPGGILVAQRDPIGLAREISKLLQNHSLRKELGTLGRDFVIREFSLVSMVKSTLDMR